MAIMMLRAQRISLAMLTSTIESPTCGVGGRSLWLPWFFYLGRSR
jgi:hypothetical protein